MNSSCAALHLLVDDEVRHPAAHDVGEMTTMQAPIARLVVVDGDGDRKMRRRDLVFALRSLIAPGAYFDDLGMMPVQMHSLEGHPGIREAGA